MFVHRLQQFMPPCRNADRPTSLFAVQIVHDGHQPECLPRSIGSKKETCTPVRGEISPKNHSGFFVTETAPVNLPQSVGGHSGQFQRAVRRRNEFYDAPFETLRLLLVPVGIDEHVQFPANALLSA